MKKAIKLALELKVGEVNISPTASFNDLLGVQRKLLLSSNLDGWEGEFADKETYSGNSFSLPESVASCYHFSDSDDLSLSKIIGVEENAYFKNIFQIYTILRDHWYGCLETYRGIFARRLMLFPYINHLNQHCIGSISQWRNGNTFSGGFNMDEGEHKDSSVHYWGHNDSGFLIVLPKEHNASFLQSHSISMGVNYKDVSLRECKKKIEAIFSDMPSENGKDRIERFEQYAIIGLSYFAKDAELWGAPAQFKHPEGTLMINCRDCTVL